MKLSVISRHRGRLLTAAAVGGIALLIAGWTATTQNFAPGRFALLAAEIDAASPQNGPGGSCRKVLARLDTQTGEVKLLQLRVFGAENPRIQSATWKAVRERRSSATADNEENDPQNTD